MGEPVATLSRGRIPVSITSGAKLIFWLLVLLTLAALALERGVWIEQFKIAGPFAVESDPPRHSLMLTVPPDLQDASVWWAEPLLGDDNEHPDQSDLRLWINGHGMGPPHGQHEAIRNGTTAGFSHWYSRVIFSLPADEKNTPETIATIGYRLRPPLWFTFVLAASSAAFGWLLYNGALRTFVRTDQWRLTSLALRIPCWALLGFGGFALIGSAAYILVSLYALATGWALPTSALIRWSSVGQWAARNEPYLGYLLLMCAGFGAITTWLAGSNLQYQRFVESDELVLRRFLFWCGFPLAVCAFVFCMSAMWTGMLRPGDQNYANIGGLIPFSDAHSHLIGAHDQARDGTWIEFALRRPLAAAFRSVLLFFGNYSLWLMLLLQACLFAAAACFATYAIVLWRGLWAGLAFFGLTYIYARGFVPTPSTEPLGLFWALLSIPFFIEAFRGGPVSSALVAFAITVTALMTRMGSMFTIPALLLWLVWQFGRGRAAKLRIGVVAGCVLLGILGLNSALQKAYGTDRGSIGSNFSYTLCGLTMGTSWDGCPKKLASQGTPMPTEEEAKITLLYSIAAENFREHPDVFFKRLIDGAVEFLRQFPDLIWKGYGDRIPEPDWLLRKLLTAVSVAGVFYIALRRAKPVELTFWMLFWLSIVASTSIVFFDDGSRTLAASHPLMALFFAMGFSSPALLSPKPEPRPRLAQYGAWGLLLAAVLFVGTPWIAHRFSPVNALARNALSSKRDEAIVFGGRRMSGFLVVADGLPLRSDVPTIHLKDFEAIIEQSGVETYQGLLHPTLPPLPFGFIYAPRLEKNTTEPSEFIVPVEVIERHDVPFWHFQSIEWGNKANRLGDYWLYVTKAEPWQPTGNRDQHGK
jgi:hypothetical protein